MPELEIADQNFDLTFLLEIADGSNEFIVESVDLFLKQTPELMYAIDDAIKAKNWPLASQSAHKLKPNLGFFGMLTGQTLMQEIEALCKLGEDNVLIRSKFNTLIQIVKPTLVKLEIIKNAKEKEL